MPKRNIRELELLAQLSETQSRVMQIQVQKRQEQFNALQSQINPHFLFNTLDTIRGLAIEEGCAEIAEIIASLASMFKYSMDYPSTLVTVSDELAHIQQFVNIQRMRFPEKFTVDEIFECDEKTPYRILIPKFTLQPIIENAITHGLKNRSTEGLITVRHILSDCDYRIIISDNGDGMDEQFTHKLNRFFSTNNPDKEIDGVLSSGIALTNIDLRVKMHFGNRYGLHIDSTPGLGTDITVVLPAGDGGGNEAGDAGA